MDLPETRQSSIMVAVRVRPFSDQEVMRLEPDEVGPEDLILGDESRVDEDETIDGDEMDVSMANASVVLQSDGSVERRGRVKSRINKGSTVRPQGIRKIVECVDDKMIIFDPNSRNPLYKIKESVLNSMYTSDMQQVNGRGTSTRGRKTSNIMGNSSMIIDQQQEMYLGSASASPLHSRRQRRYNGNSAGSEIKFVFDKLFDEEATQREVYQSTTSSLLDSVLDGFNSTVFAYGATGCGKTYTVSGTPENPGIIFQAMEELFQKMEDLKDIKNFQISLSFLEIYNERIRDLLNPETASQKLVIREDSDNKITVSNLSYHFPTTVQDVMDLVIKGNFNRTTSPTEANEVSSRSHAVLQIHILQSNRSVELKDHQTFGTLSIIDLAGSERAASTKNRGARLHEGANINRSLLALGNCINALCINGNNGRSRCHVPYRDSKLTRLLKFSLGGNCKTVMIVCISPSSTHYDETLNTLKYANRAKEIKTKLIRNQQSLNRHVGSYLKMITEQKKEIDELRAREAKMLQVHLSKYKATREAIDLAITDCVNNVRFQYTQVPKFRNCKLIKSLILCKRRFLQLIILDLDKMADVIVREQEENGEISVTTDDASTIDKIAKLKEQLRKKIKQLEHKFDSHDELDVVIENVRTVDLLKLAEMENWNHDRDPIRLEQALDHVSEQLRNDILIHASQMTEKLFDEQCPLHTHFFNYKYNKYKYKYKSIDPALHGRLDNLVHIDQMFEEFGKSFLDMSTSSYTPAPDTSTTTNTNSTTAPAHAPAQAPAPAPEPTLVSTPIEEGNRKRIASNDDPREE
ncbi:tubulin-dependent ATPase KIP3 [Nakaseomyces bracarensis]|uniref:tubulin-dependent ATPase KIP3 n=1 Tax=Nakaseomyces bracarensis TaxID=273131 RepID=UPI0038711560